ncbi:MAG: xylose isomerase [Solirubrobacteraceae bacterium]
MDGQYDATPEDRFTFGLWTVGHRGGDPFGLPTRPPIEPEEIVTRLAEVGAWGVSLHDDDLIPFGSSAAERDRIVARFGEAVRNAGLCVPMTTVNLFTQPVFRDGALTAADPAVRRFALRKAVGAIDTGAELGASVFVMWGGREGVESAAARDPRDALERYREGVDFLCEYVRSQGLTTRIALEAKPNEPRGHIYLPTTGHMLHFIETLAHPDMVGVNPETAHEAMAGLSFSAAVGQALWAGKLFHVDLNAQNGPRFDQDFRFGAEDLKEAFLTVRLLERSGYSGPRHFDARAYRSEDDLDVYAAFARGCIRNYKILAAKAAAFDADEAIRAACIAAGSAQLAEPTPAFSAEALAAIRDEDFDALLANREGRHHERADQLMIELLLGV